jgi:hypothetical protein
LFRNSLSTHVSRIRPSLVALSLVKAESNDDWWDSPKRDYSWSGGRNQGKRKRDSRRKAEMAAHSSCDLPVQDKGNTTLVPTPPPPPMNTMIPKDSGSVAASLHSLPTPPPAPMKRTRTDDSDCAPASMKAIRKIGFSCEFLPFLMAP